ncbi:hypothetical protein [Rugamonas sp.]|uniref:hypothetical protein n=1 Tax=Rugamonas sp. TaxID=1926287 RepID=UPI0025E6F5CC|nr:hypothetical protein [Rugamonas sp.]
MEMKTQYDAAMGVLTYLIVAVPATLGKIFKQTPNGLEKTTAGEFYQGKFVVKFFTTVLDLVTLLTSVTTSQAITASVPVTGAIEGAIVTKAMLAKFPDALTRTKKHFSFLFGQKGIIILDYDPPAGKVALTRDQLWCLLVATIPELCSAGVVWWCSGSSYIYSGEVEMQGLRGQRLYIMVDDISDTERVCDILAKRLWLAGHGYIAISKSGKRLIRSIFDAAMAEAARMDYIGGSTCHAPLEQRRGAPVVLSEGSWLKTREVIKDLSAADDAKYQMLVQDAKAKVAGEARLIEEAWKAERMTAMVIKLSNIVPQEQAAERAEQTLSAATKGFLLGDFDVKLADGCTVTVGHILDNRERYNGALTFDPLEPEYANHKVTGKLFLYGAVPTLNSFAHGGAVYFLRRQPHRLYLQRGRKAELADAIYKVLSDEPDVFVRGGKLVQIDGNRVRPLHKAGLTYLIGMRTAIYVKKDNGPDIAADVPGDVVEMVMDLVEA